MEVIGYGGINWGQQIITVQGQIGCGPRSLLLLLNSVIVMFKKLQTKYNEISMAVFQQNFIKTENGLNLALQP